MELGVVEEAWEGVSTIPPTPVLFTKLVQAIRLAEPYAHPLRIVVDSVAKTSNRHRIDMPDEKSWFIQVLVESQSLTILQEEVFS
jgi:hypothetical protein